MNVYQSERLKILVPTSAAFLLFYVEVGAFPQTLNNQLLAFRTAVDVLDVICKTSVFVRHKSMLNTYQW
jgi:hypothetical protein